MQRALKVFQALVICSLVLIGIHACTHEPFEPLPDDDTMVIDTMPIDTMPVDTMMTDTTDICDPDIVYFDRDVLPLLRSNCAFSGCHNAASAEDGVILESYESTIETADVEAYDLDGSKLYEVLVETREDKRMPRPPAARLTADQIQLISKWILQGAKDLDCQPAASCETNNVSYAQQVLPVITNFCKGCHSGTAPSGGIALTTHAEVQTVALNGRLYGAISWQNGFQRMPQGGNKLPDCTIDQFKSWIDAGAPNN